MTRVALYARLDPRQGSDTELQLGEVGQTRERAGEPGMADVNAASWIMPLLMWRSVMLRARASALQHWKQRFPNEQIPSSI